MTMKYTKILFILACFLLYQKLLPDPIVTFFFKPYPNPEQFIAKIHKPGKIAKKHLESLGRNNLTAGILSTYAGFLGISNTNGQTIFPQKHQSPFIYLAITNKMIPITMFANTIHHWEFEPMGQNALYKIEKKQDPQTKIVYWNVEPLDIPKNNIIPLESVVVIAKPKNMYVPTGITMVKQNSPSLFIPDLFVKKGINIVGNALYMLGLTHLFSPVSLQYKKELNRFATLPKD